MELNYKRCGDYLIPDVTCHHTNRSLGRYGRLRKSFLKQYNPIYYNELLLTEKLFDHCLKIEDAAIRPYGADSTSLSQGRRCHR